MEQATSVAAILRRARRHTALVLLGVVLGLLLAYVALESIQPLRLTRMPAESSALGFHARPEIDGCASPGGAAPTPGAYRCRFLVNHDAAAFTLEWQDSIRREQAWWKSTGHAGPLPPASLLAISGGGDSGAFGAGLLVGWSQAGTRPEFKIVTGISTGALSAPLAFLGRQRDGDLEAIYTKISQRDVFKPRTLLSAITEDALSDTTPLYRLLERHVDRPMLDAIAAEYAKGRLLFIGTCDLDSLEPVVWNMTAIAASKDPRALDLFRKILLASAAIPAAFPPVMIDVDADGRRYQEMHVDGGASAQVFLYPAPSVHIAQVSASMGVRRQRTLYVIRNARLDPEWAIVNRSTLPIAQRAVSSLMQRQGVGDLYRIYALTHRDGIDFNLAFIPSTFTVRHTKQFDTHFMQALFDTGRKMALAGYPWQKTPPGYDEP
jgi:predicted acylesterase/phospholipase RssA